MLINSEINENLFIKQELTMKIVYRIEISFYCIKKSLIIIEYKDFKSEQTDLKIKCLISDNVGEFKYDEFDELCENN